MATVRDATGADQSAIRTLYNAAVATGTATWDEAPRTHAQQRGWWRARLAAGGCVLVAELDGRFAGFGGFGPFRPFSGYRFTVEHGLYVHDDCRRRGVGRALLRALVARARAQGRHALVGGIDAGNAASLALHAAEGFELAGVLPEVGRKFDRWLDLAFVVRRL